VGGPVFGFSAGSFQNPRLKSRGSHGGLLTWVPDLDQSVNAFIEETLLPSGDCRRSGLQALLDICIAVAVGQQQDHARPEDNPGRQTAR
jgi:hypothetical protein